jgi:glycosyltransferase involved in cell wall biosynthesis
MKVMLLGAGSVIHTQRWANGLVQTGVQVLCVSQHDFLPGGWDEHVECVRLARSGNAGYFLNARAVRRLFVERGCALLNAHYASGYGVLATRAGVRPRLVSVWGSDVYDFPRTSPLHRALLRRVLGSADALASTSLAMAREVEQLLGAARRPIAITPFGVDVGRFGPREPAAGDAAAPVVVGIVKTLAPKYGIDTLLRAFARLEPRHDGLRLRIVGDGPDRAALQALAVQLGIGARCEFVGAVAHADVPVQLRGLDIFAAASRLDSESFGVAVIEASACALPVVVTRVGGLPEVVSEGETGLIVERDDVAALAAALQRLVDDGHLREHLGRNGRTWVAQRYEWRACVERMVQTYRDVLASAGRSA